MISRRIRGAFTGQVGVNAIGRTIKSMQAHWVNSAPPAYSSIYPNINYRTLGVGVLLNNNLKNFHRVAAGELQPFFVHLSKQQ